MVPDSSQGYFEWALLQMRARNKVKRSGWGADAEYLALVPLSKEESQIQAHKENITWKYTPTQEDILASDWSIA